jgi:hypothetical protein
MAAGEQGRSQIGRSWRSAGDLSALPGWALLGVALGVTALLCIGAHFAGVPDRWAPLVIGGGLGLMAALVTGAPVEDERRDEQP